MVDSDFALAALGRTEGLLDYSRTYQNEENELLTLYRHARGPQLAHLLNGGKTAVNQVCFIEAGTSRATKNASLLGILNITFVVCCEQVVTERLRDDVCTRWRTYAKCHTGAFFATPKSVRRCTSSSGTNPFQWWPGRSSIPHAPSAEELVQ